ncbi:MAG TPA: Nif3-like dinuclear metal center hexameric protein [Gemmataceae bacterium]|nr:Nif3-like dinuclear metal center hexameric protein [Gemmataceae bacterium]
MPNIADLCAFLEAFAPARLAADWDNVGLLLGDRSAPCVRVMTCLTITPASAAEAVDRRASLIIAHHPIFFRPMQRLTSDTVEGAMLWRLAQAGVAVYSPHTAFDNATLGINARLGDRLGLREIVPLRASQATEQCKLVIFVPMQNLNAVADALFTAGAGHIGHYRECSFRQEGIGTFFGSEAANPTVGQKGRREEVAEYRLEAICPRDCVEAAMAAMRKAHSYEEPAYDVYPLLAKAGKEGEGRLGVLPAPVSLRQFAGLVREQLGCTFIQVCGPADRQVQRVALACGAAAEFQEDAVQARADVFLTGEARFHDCLSAQAHGISLVLAGHYATERFAVDELAESIGKAFGDLEIWASERERDPLWTV